MPDIEIEDSSSLEGTGTTLETVQPGSGSNAGVQTPAAPPPMPVVAEPGSVAAKQPKAPRENYFTGRFNIYGLLFIVVLLITGGIALVTALADDKAGDETQATVNSQSLSADALKQLANTDAVVGDPKQVLSVQSNAVFAGKVLVRDSLEVAGQLRVGSGLSLPGISVTGESNFDQVQVNRQLNVGGDAAVLGQLNVKRNISVPGGGTFGGGVTAPQITTNQLQLLGDLNLTRHIATGGPTPGRSNGSSLGSGGTVSIGGSDGGGSVNINTGSGTAAGCMVTVNFAQRYNDTPHVVISPVGSAAASIDYYVNRISSGFSICSTSTPPPNAGFGFDYFVVE